MDQLLAAYFGNPFARTAAEVRRAERVATTLDLDATITALLDQGQLDRAKALLLAMQHRAAIANPTLAPLLALLSTATAKRLPRPLRDYARIALAAGRCYRVLDRIHGDSAANNRARRDTWAACFGDSLRHTLELERVIRDHDVLLLGETGTGKELFARAIVAATPGDSRGAPAPSAALNAAALPDALVESELFGHSKGAFTGAAENRIGRLRSAHGGTFFLDEVGDLPSTTQVKLLRVIETNEVYPLGSDTPHTVDVRYVAATHKELETLVEEGSFRRDLLERLAGNVIRTPALRERPEDIPAIAMAFVADYTTGSAAEHVHAWLTTDEVRRYAWPGNVRELQNVLRNLLLGLPARPAAAAAAAEASATVPAIVIEGRASLRMATDWYLRHVLANVDGNYSRAARILGIDRSTVKRRC